MDIVKLHIKIDLTNLMNFIN